MSSATAAPRVSAALATFVAGPHAGADFDRACDDARERYLRARAAAARPGPLGASVAAALASFAGPAYARALALGAAFAADPELAEGAATLAVALVVAERGGLDDADAIAAVAVGAEVERRVLAAVCDDDFARRWDAAPIGARFGAVAAAARLARLDATRARTALGIAATQASGTALARGTDAGALACGKAAADALEAVALAAHGFTAPAAPLEGRRGFAAVQATRFDPAAILAGLGERWGGRATG
jgi:2-methylcitrate dehydratase PrpD